MNSRMQSQKSLDGLLIQQAATGDLDAFNQLVLSNQDMVFHHAFALLGDQASAQDAAQESFIKAFKHIAHLRGGSFRAWLLKIVTHAAYDQLRRSKRHHISPLFPEDEDGEEMDSAPWLTDRNPSIPEAVEHNELSREIFRTLDELPEVYRSVMTLIDLYEFDYLEAAQALRVPIGTIKSRLARGRLQMRQKLKSNRDYETGLMDRKRTLLQNEL